MVRVPLPYGSPSAPACVILVTTRAAVTPAGNAGTVTVSCPVYVDVLETSFAAPPELAHVTPCRRGSASTGCRAPQIRLYRVLESALPQFRTWGQSTGKFPGGGVLDQSVLMRPAFVSWNEMVPVDE